MNDIHESLGSFFVGAPLLAELNAEDEEIIGSTRAMNSAARIEQIPRGLITYGYRHGFGRAGRLAFILNLDPEPAWLTVRCHWCHGETFGEREASRLVPALSKMNLGVTVAPSNEERRSLPITTYSFAYIPTQAKDAQHAPKN